MIKQTLLLTVCALACLGLAVDAESPPMDVLKTTPLGQVQEGGYLGQRIDVCITNRVMAQDVDYLVNVFTRRNETRLWQTEFWGKWITSAIAAYQYAPRPEYLTLIKHAVTKLIATQTPDGYIGNYADKAHLGEWDIWGRKYTLLGLIAYYDLTADDEVLKAARHLADHLLTEVGPGKADIIKTGNYWGMPSCSILEPIILLYRRTGDVRYLDFAQYIVGRIESDGAPQLIKQALAGVHVADRYTAYSKPVAWNYPRKAYEMMSCYEGILELYRITGNPDYRKAVEQAVDDIIATELFITGSGSLHEGWFHGKKYQMLAAEHTQETCVTMTWMKLLQQMMRLTGNAKYADHFEISLYNALMAAMAPDGSTFSKYTVTVGTREAYPGQCNMTIHCCTANGPRALLLAPAVTVMQGEDRIVINLYNASTARVNLGAQPVEIVQATTYPVSDQIEITVNPAAPVVFTLGLRIPAWSEQNALTINGQSEPAPVKGTYQNLHRRWTKGDKVVLRLDLHGRVLAMGRYHAIVRGPVVLARDMRFADGDVDEVVEPHSRDGFIKLTPVAQPPATMWMAYRALFQEGVNRENHQKDNVWLNLCDYASAGNTWKEDSRYRVWLETPFTAEKYADEK